MLRFLLMQMLLLVCYSNKLSGQELITMSSAKVGFLGAWASLEVPVSEKFLVVGEFGQEFGFFGGIRNSETIVVATNTLSLEGKFYYNRSNRIDLGKTLKYNAGNYLSLEIQRTPDWATYSTNNDDVRISKSVNIIPKIGIRRTFFESIIFELGGGVGYQYNDSTKNVVTLAVDLRLGFFPIVF